MRLHHIAVVVDRIAESVKIYERLLGLKVHAATGVDPVQKVDAVFLDLGRADQVTLELLEPTAEDSPIARARQKGGGLHHLCFEVDDIEAEVARIRAAGGRVICEPVPACGLGNRRIAFVFPVDNILVELLETSAS